jgi:hypothetical protein
MLPMRAPQLWSLGQFARYNLPPGQRFVEISIGVVAGLS